MDIDKLILYRPGPSWSGRFGSLMDIDKLIPLDGELVHAPGFGSLMDICSSAAVEDLIWSE